MKLTFLDTETTGLDVSKGARIIEICLLTYDANTRTCVDRYIQRFDPQCPIEPKAQEIHGIAYGDLVGMPVFADQASVVADRLAESVMLVAHNMEFDGPFIASELSGAGVGVPSVDSFCTMENGRWATPNGKRPNLGELCFSLGVDYDPEKAHGAEYDVEVMAECFFKALDRGFYKMPEQKVAA